MSTHPKWNFEEFTTFLLLYASKADMHISEEEEQAMQSRLDPDHYKAVKKEFEESSDYQHIQTIMSYKGLYFPTAEQREELLDLLKKQFFADGEFSLMEQNLFRFLKKLL